MPELPDLEVFQQNLLTQVKNKTIVETGCNAVKALTASTPEELNRISQGQQFTNISRRGKHLIFHISNDSKLILHLMLRGRLEYGSILKEHALSDCFWFQFNDGNELRIIDQTSWIKLEVIKDGNLQNSKLLSKLGPEADEIDLEKFSKILKASRLGRIKPLLMDQKKLAGIGNAYADEILWKSKINPGRSASLLTDNEIKTLHLNIQKVLSWGIDNNKKEAHGKLAESRREWMNIYRKKGKPCPECGTLIEYTKVNQRDTFYCPKCQKSK